ncbi:MAG: GWxTD domain-containing protein [Salinivirgaceae bacterium]|nr:GWxTD domain-containing protein [Salinivirgaceae bacterium]
MRRLLFLFVFIAILIQIKPVQSQGLDAYFYYCPFFAPEKGTYVETYCAFAGNSVHYIMTPDSLLQASVEVTMLFKNADKIKEFRKFTVVSPPLPDTATFFPSFIDLQRISIPEGVYNFELIVKDIYAPDTVENFHISTILTINIPEKEFAFSGIEFIERYEKAYKTNLFVKNGYECIPYVSDFFPENVDYLKFYLELYNTAKELGPLEDFLISFHIENYNTSKPIKEFSSFQKQQAYNVNVVFKELNISKLPTGNYYLVIEIRNRKNELVLSTSKFFQRMKSGIEQKKIDLTEIVVQNTFASFFVNRDTLAIYLSALRPMSDISENRFIDNQLEIADIKLMQQFFYSFWEKRNQTNPEYAWLEYKQNLNNVEEKYGTRIRTGYQTDRGRVYLQYGQPNSVISERNESNAYPYEIWHYYKIADQTDKKFIFYNKSLTGKDYELLHSNMIGELSNPQWEIDLYSRMDGQSNSSINHSKAKEYFEGN